MFLRKAFDALNDNPNLTILGNDMARRLPIFSMIFYHQDSGKLVHHNFVSVLLNDLYGIQARGGCACAGPYAQVSLNWFISDTRFFSFYMITVWNLFSLIAFNTFTHVPNCGNINLCSTVILRSIIRSLLHRLPFRLLTF